MFSLLYTSTKTLNLGYVTYGAVYLPSWGAVLYHGTYPIEAAAVKVYPDGTAFNLGKTGAVGGAGHYLSSWGQGVVHLYNYVDDGGGYHDVNDIVWLDDISGLPRLGDKLNAVDLTGKVGSGSVVDPGNGLVYTPGSRVLVSGRWYQEVRVYSLKTGALMRTMQIDYGDEYWSALAVRLHAASDNQFLLYAQGYGDGKVLFCDSLSGAVTLSGRVDPDYRVLTYDPVHGLIVAVMHSGQIALYLPVESGHTLSQPVFAAPPALLTAVRVTTRLTGSDGVGVAGKAVQWSLAGERGNLKWPVTVTDADGYAINWYYGPTGAYGLGDETIHVEVSI